VPTARPGAGTIAARPRRREAAGMIVAADYPFMDILGTMLVFFLWIMWFWTLIVVLTDVFARRDVSGWVKAGWTVFTLFLPILGVLVYLIAEGRGMAERRETGVRDQRKAIDDHIRSVASADGPATEIANAKHLLDSGTIDQTEFQALKRRALA
jgi:Phospholipase_D-nuclease N-terminal